jgi:hypothetical protein
MGFDGWSQFVLVNFSRDRIVLWTLWILAFGLLVGVSLHLAKWIVRDFKDLQREISRPVAAKAQNEGLAE